MKILLSVLAIAIIVSSCNIKKDNSASNVNEEVDLKKKELELKEKELAIKEKEMQEQRERDLEERERRVTERELTTERRVETTTPRTTTRSGFPGVYPEASTRRLSASDVNYLSKYQLKIMRNEIFARHGYIFKTTDMKNYFSNQRWYDPRYSNVDNLLTSTEKHNIELIKRYER